MQLEALLSALFGRRHDVTDKDQLIRGTAEVAGGPITVLGTSGPAAIGARLALALAEGVLETVERHPQQPILFLVNTSGQALARHEELIGINSYLAHLAACIDLARRQGHPTSSLVYGEAVSGGYLSFGLMADRAYALADAQVRVMDLRAMARVTKIPHERLVALARESPVFAPGADNYVRMGAIDGIWHEPSAALLETALGELRSELGLRRHDRRSEVGFERGGRRHAKPTADAVVAAD
ncbi:MAG TPA: biotin-independent malonate decarboxylase subunit gamma [Burkholderiaceae bacterium]|nr:biotin-independent malonate decarboxylase subunit gamma [Burkholderiaceae bacterium]